MVLKPIFEFNSNALNNLKNRFLKVIKVYRFFYVFKCNYCHSLLLICGNNFNLALVTIPKVPSPT